MLVGRSHNTEFITQFQTILNGSFPLAGAHIVQVWIVALIAFSQTVTGIHFYERGLVSFGKAFPVIAAITTLIAHMVRSDEYFVSFGLLFPVFDGSAFYKRCIEIVVQGNMVAMFHAVCFISNESEEFSFFIIFVCHGYVLLIAAFAQTFESTGMVVDYPFQAWIVCSGDIRPHGVGCYTYKIQLSFRCFKSIAHIAVSVCDVTMVVQVSPVHFEVTCRWHFLFGFFTSCRTRAEQAAGCCQS